MLMSVEEKYMNNEKAGVRKREGCEETSDTRSVNNMCQEKKGSTKSVWKVRRDLRKSNKDTWM